MSSINNINKNTNNKKLNTFQSSANNNSNKTSLIQNQTKVLQPNQQINQQSQQIHQQMLNQGKKNWNVESPKFLKYFFKDCQNQEKMSTLVELQKRQIEEENNLNSFNRTLRIDNDQNMSNEFQSQKLQAFQKNSNSSNVNSNIYNNTLNINQINNPLDFSKFTGQFFNSPIIPHIPSDFQTKTPNFDVTELIECLAELKPANIISGKKKNSSSHINTSNGANGCEWNVNEQDVTNLIKKYSIEGYKSLLMQDYKQALVCLKKSEILMNSYVAKDGKIECEILLFIKANLGICFYRIGLLQEAFTSFCICLAYLKKQNIKSNNNHPRNNMEVKSNSNQNIISNQYKKRSYSNLPNIDQSEYLQIIAQKLKKKKLKGDLLLQACIVLSEQGKHEEALIIGNKASKLQLNYIIDTLTSCYHVILQMIKERDQQLNNAEGYLQKAQTSRRGNSAHQHGTSSTYQTNYFSHQQNKDIKNSNMSYNIFDGDFVQELQSQQHPLSQGFFKKDDLKEKISYLEKLIPILKEVMKRTNDLHSQYINPSKLKILEVMNKIINNSNFNSNNMSTSIGKQVSSKGIKSVQSPSSSSCSFKQTDKDNQNTGDNNWSFEVSLYERPDLEFLFKTITSSSHWILKTNILSLLQLKAISFDETQINKVSIEQEICIDSILNKLSHLCVSFYCISTETRFINDQKKNKQKENSQLSNQPTSQQNQLLLNQSKYAKFLQNLNYEVSESENWLSRSLEIAYVFLPHDMPLVGQIVSVHNKFHNVNKIVIKEDDNEHIEDDDESLYDQSYDQEEYNSNSNQGINCNKDKQNLNNIHNSEYASPLVTLPGGSKSNFFIPLVRKIKPQITKCPHPKDELEEEINKLYNSYTSNLVQNTPEYSTTVESNSSTAQLCINNSHAEKSEVSKQKQSQSMNHSQNYSSNQGLEQQTQKPLKEKLLSTNTQNIHNNNINNKSYMLTSTATQNNQQTEFNENQINRIKQNLDIQKVQRESFNTTKDQIQNITKKQIEEVKQYFQEGDGSRNNKSNPRIDSAQQQLIHKLSSTTPADIMQLQLIQQQLQQQQQQSLKYIQQNQFQSTAEQNISRISKTADFSMQLQKQQNDEYEEFEDQDEYNLDEFQIMDSNPQIFLQNIQQNTQQNQQQNLILQQNQQIKNPSNSMTSNNHDNQNKYQSSFGDSKYDQIRKSQERKLKDKHYQQYQQLIQQRNQNIEKRQNSQESKQRSQSNGSSTKQSVQNQMNNSKQYQQAFNNSNIVLFNSNNLNNQIQILNSQQENISNSGCKKKRVLSLANDSSTFSQQSLQQGLCSPQYIQQIQQQEIQYMNGSSEQPMLQQFQNPQQKQLKKILSKPLSAERKYRTIDTSLNSIKNITNNSNFINNVNILLDAGNYPQSAKNSSSNSGNQNSARQQIQQISQTFEVKRKSSTGNAPASKTARSNSFNKTAKSSSNHQNNNQQKNIHPSTTSSSSSTTANSLINNSSLINQNQNSQKSHVNNNQNTNDKQIQKALKNNYISEHILNEIFDINNMIKPIHNRGQSMQIQSSSLSSTQQAHQCLQQQQLIAHQQYLQNNSPQIQQQLINNLTNNNNINSKRLNSKENVQRSNSSNKSGQRKNKKNLDIQVNQQMMQFNNVNEDAINVSKSSRNSSNPSNFLQDNYMNIFKGSQSTKSSQNQPIFQNQQSLMNKYSCQSTTNNQKDINSMINSSMNASMLSKNQTPKNTNITFSVNPQNTSSVSNDKKLHMLRKFRSTVGKVPEDLLKKK